ncbi:hypothetical protein [Sorangium sp. So ce426]|uniref:hypothetical protein n=1 Tax=Sorangium sp. So ce426 TaxID=3133312 RepID=UPI003F5CA561
MYPTQSDGKRPSTAAAQQLPARPAAAKAHTAIPASSASYEVVVLAPPLTGFATDLLLPGALPLR